MSFAKRAHVEDKKTRWKGITHAVAAADGLELRIGLMNWKLRYPKKRGRTEIAKVAGILQIYPAISGGYDKQRATIDTAFARVHAHLLAGKPEVEELIYRIMGVPVRDAMRAAAMKLVNRQSGRMELAIRATVFDNVKPGRRGPMHTGDVVAGDDPKRPKPSEALGSNA